MTKMKGLSHITRVHEKRKGLEENLFFLTRTVEIKRALAYKGEEDLHLRKFALI